MNTRKTHLDVLRVIACLFVIATHFGFGYSVYQSKTAGSMPYWISLAISISCHFAVPMYFMISGALLLGKEESLTVLYKKRVSRIVITLLIASGIYYVVEKYVLNQPFPIGQIYSGEAYYHLWYLYAYIAYLAFLPFLRIIAKKMTKPLFDYMFFTYIAIIGIIPIFELLFFNNATHLNQHLQITPFAMRIFIMPLVGYYLENKFDINKVSEKRLLLLWLADISLILLSAYATKVYAVPYAQTYLGCFAPVHAITLFITVKVQAQKNSKTQKSLSSFSTKIAPYTLGIYILHMIPMQILTSNLQLRDMYSQIGFLPQLLVWIIVVVILFFLSYVFTKILHKIPFFAKYL